MKSVLSLWEFVLPFWAMGTRYWFSLMCSLWHSTWTNTNFYANFIIKIMMLTWQFSHKHSFDSLHIALKLTRWQEWLLGKNYPLNTRTYMAKILPAKLDFHLESISLPNLRHCLRIPPVGIFFSCSSSAKLVELANTSISVIFITRFSIDTACSIDKPCVGSSISTSP